MQIQQVFVALRQPVANSVTVFYNPTKLTNYLLYLSGTYCHKTSTRPHSRKMPRDSRTNYIYCCDKFGDFSPKAGNFFFETHGHTAALSKQDNTDLFFPIYLK